MSMQKLAEHCIAVSHDNDLGVSNLQLQKVMYFVSKEIISMFGKDYFKDNFYNEPFLLFKYGPTILNVYEKYRIWGSDDIGTRCNQAEDYKIYNRIIISLLKEKPFELVKTAREEPVWRVNADLIDGWNSKYEYTIENICGESIKLKQPSGVIDFENKDRTATVKDLYEVADIILKKLEQITKNIGI